MKTVRHNTFVLVLVLGIVGAILDHWMERTCFLGWLLPAAAAISVIAGELSGIRQALRKNAPDTARNDRPSAKDRKPD